MFRLTPEAQARVSESAAWAAERRATVANLTNENLVAMARLYMANMTPCDFAPGEPVYDATMWHIILPEMMRRITHAGRAVLTDQPAAPTQAGE